MVLPFSVMLPWKPRLALGAFSVGQLPRESEGVTALESAFQVVCRCSNQVKRPLELIDVEVQQRRCVPNGHKIAHAADAAAHSFTDGAENALKVDRAQLPERRFDLNPFFRVVEQAHPPQKDHL
jgi:hypothetical protein